MAYPGESPSNNSDQRLIDGSSQTNTGGQYTSTGVSIGSPADARLSASGLAAGAVNVLSSIAGRVLNINYDQGDPVSNDWRVRVSMAPEAAKYFYQGSSPWLKVLQQTNGVIFPYTPQVTVVHNARYGDAALTHSNYKAYFYEGSDVQAITIAGEFTVQDISEGQYLMAAIHFFRSATKMFFGQDALAGTPPPMVFLNGYGSPYFPNVPCVVTSFSHTMPSDVDYVDIPVGFDINATLSGLANNTGASTPARLPASSTISITLQPVYSRKNIHNNFTLAQFAKGDLVTRGFI